MGRYFSCRIHPFSVAEIIRPHRSSDAIVHKPTPISQRDWDDLMRFGGFPEPFMRRDDRFSRRWQKTRKERLFKEDIRDLTRVQELGQIEALAQILADRSGQQIVFANLAQEVQVAPNTVKGWVQTLVATYYGFLVRPWFRNVSRALRKEPKWFLRDWSEIADFGARAETITACHLLKAVEYWNDCGLGEFDLRYIRDKQKREVDFLVVRDGEPWFLVESKQSDLGLSPALAHFQKETGARHAFQVVITHPYHDKDCFSFSSPVVVSARTLFSQLV